MNAIMTIEGVRARNILASVDLGTAVTVNLAGVEESIKSRFVGMDENDFIILRFNRQANIIENLFENNRLKARFIVTGKILGFQSLVKAHLLKGPLSLALVNYPKKLEAYDARQSKRVKVFMPAELELNGEIHQGIILDMSAGGVLFAFNHNPKKNPSVDEHGNVSCEFMGIQGVQRFSGLIKSVRDDHGRTLIGLAYHNLDQQLATTLESYFKRVDDYLDNQA